MTEENKLKPDDLPEGFDPYDINLKKQLHERADAKNLVGIRGKSVVLLCGAKKKKNRGDGVCRSIAGTGTQHPGFGRCKFCGGNNTGPRSPEAKARVSQNARKHGFYSKVLTAEERDTYEELLVDRKVGLEDEIFLLKAKILSYLGEYNRRRLAGRKATLEYVKEGESINYFHAGTIEDPVLTRALETLRRMVDSFAKLTGQDSGNLIDDINKELRQASQKEANTSWETPAQDRGAVQE